MDRYEIKFYDNSTLLTTNSDNKRNNLLSECKRLKTLTKEVIHRELGCNPDIAVTHFIFLDYKTGKLITEHVFS